MNDARLKVKRILSLGTVETSKLNTTWPVFVLCIILIAYIYRAALEN